MKFVFSILSSVMIFNSVFADIKTYNYTGINGKKHSYSVFSPKNHNSTKSSPCVIFFHGGSWLNGGRNQFKKMCEYFATRGMVAITADYSMHSKDALKSLKKGESKKRVCVIDGKSVIRHVIKNSSKLGIDTDKLILGGASAGGHISVMSALDKKFDNKKDPKVNFSVKGFLLFCPAFTELSKDKTPDVNVFNNLEGNIPPMMFITGEKDPWERASRTLLNSLVKKSSNVQYWLARGEKHMFYGKGKWLDLSLIKADNFLVSIGILDDQKSLKIPEGLILTDISKTSENLK